MKKIKLKDCYFCGSGSVKLHRNFDYVYCEACGARGSYFDGHPEDAINTWNKVSMKYVTGPFIIPTIQKINLDGTKGMTRGE